MAYVSPLTGEDVLGTGYAEHLLVWSWRRIATGQRYCPLMQDAFASACGEEGAEVFAAFCTFLKALAVAGRRPFVVGAPGCPAIKADERQVLTLLAAAQTGIPALLEAHLCWIAAPDKRHVLAAATAVLAQALSLHGLCATPPAHRVPTVRERPRAVA